MVDKVKPLKIETSIDGTEVDMLPTESDPTEDYLSSKGLAIENQDDILVDADGSGNLQFTDQVTGTKIMSDLLDADQEDFAPGSTDLTSTKTGPAIRELRGQTAHVYADSSSQFLMNDPTIYHNNALVYTYNSSTATYTDVSAAALSTSGSTIQIPGLAYANAFYVSVDLQDGGDYVKFPGFEFSCTQAALAGVISIEYWSIYGWLSTNSMVTETSGDYLPESNTAFYNTGIRSIRMEQYSVNFWIKNDPISSGTNRYWIRFRVTSTLTQVPILEYLHPMPNCIKINSTGFTEYFGTARPMRRIPLSFSGAVAAYSTPGTDPSSTNLYYSQNLGVGRQLNTFVDGVTDRQTFVAYVPPDIDTSMPIHFRAQTVGTSGTTGNVVYTIYYNCSYVGSTVNDTYASAAASSSGESSNTITVSYSAADQVFELGRELDIESCIPRSANLRNAAPALIWITLERQGAHASDTYTGDTSVIDLSLIYSAWSNGGPV